MNELFVIDNSVIQRQRDPAIAAATDGLLDRGELATCLPLLLEAGYSARSHAHHSEIIERELAAKVVLEPGPAVIDAALRIQSALWKRGTGRAVGVSDLEIAATAIQHSTPERPVTVVHYGADFDHIREVAPGFRAEWIVPRGSAD